VPKPVANRRPDQRIPGSDLKRHIIYVEMNDGTYSPIAMMKPAGNGRFPARRHRAHERRRRDRVAARWLQYGNWTPEQLVKAGYAGSRGCATAAR